MFSPSLKNQGCGVSADYLKDRCNRLVHRRTHSSQTVINILRDWNFPHGGLVDFCKTLSLVLHKEWEAARWRGSDLWLDKANGRMHIPDLAMITSVDYKVLWLCFVAQGEQLL